MGEVDVAVKVMLVQVAVVVLELVEVATVVY